MSTIRSAFLLATAAVTLSACDEPAPRYRKNQAPAPAAAGPPPAPAERAGPVAWDDARQAFVMNGRPMKAARLFTFDNSTEGWTAGGGVVLKPAKGGGLSIANFAADPILLSPKGLAIDGAHNPLVVIRLTRLAPGAAWSGAIFYLNAAHGPTEQFHGKPADRKDPAVNETVTLVYDMSQLTAGGRDWTNSTIDQLRFDTDDAGGGKFLIRQIAVTDNPAVAAPP
jgi:hypothetical protein